MCVVLYIAPTPCRVHLQQYSQRDALSCTARPHTHHDVILGMCVALQLSAGVRCLWVAACPRRRARLAHPQRPHAVCRSIPITPTPSSSRGHADTVGVLGERDHLVVRELLRVERRSPTRQTPKPLVRELPLAFGVGDSRHLRKLGVGQRLEAIRREQFAELRYRSTPGSRPAIV